MASWIEKGGQTAKNMIYKDSNKEFVRYAFEMAEVHVIAYLTLVQAINRGIFTYEESEDRLKITPK